MPRESFETPYGTCWATREVVEGPPCKEVLSEIGKNDLADYDMTVLDHPYSLEAWNYVIKQVNNLLVCGEHHGLVPVFDVIASEENPHVWTIRDMHDILTQICPEIMQRYGDKPAMWDRKWLETVMMVIENGWCQIKETEVPCEPLPSEPPPEPYKLALNLVVAGEVSESYIFRFPTTCYHYRGISSPILWTSDMGGIQFSMYSGANTVGSGGVTPCASPYCTNELTGFATIAPSPNFDPVTGNNPGVIITTTMNGPNGTYSWPKRSLTYPSYHCNGPYTAMGGFINVTISRVIIYR